MKATMKKACSLALALCLALGVIPAAQNVQAAESVSVGALVSDKVIAEYKNGVFHGLTKNDEGQDILAVPIYGRKMMVYNLDTWEVADEVYTGISNPRGATVTADGKVWVCGDTKTLCCYDPVTRACFISSQMNLGAGSAFALTQGTDGNLYFGTYSNAKIARYNIATDTFTDLGTPKVPDGKGGYESFAYASAVEQKGDYIYASLHGKTVHKLVKLKLDGSLVVSIDISQDMATNRYLSGLNFIGDTDILVAYASSSAMGSIVVDASTMTRLPDLGGYALPVKGNVTESYNGKVYFPSFQTIGSYKDVLYAYDLRTQVAVPVQKADGSYLYGNILRGNARNIVTDGIDYLGIEGACIVTVQGTNIITYDLSTNEHKIHSKNTPVSASQGTGQSLRAATLGLPGSNEIYFGAYDTNTIGSYNTATGEIRKAATAVGSQTDAFYWYDGVLYCGNYNVCSLTRIENGEATSLFQLNNTTFEQARIHTITAGDGRIFAGTTPDMYYHGGTVAWYDMNDGFTYVVTGPAKSDVYCAMTYDDGLVADPVWYNAATGEAVQLQREDFEGLIPGQTINKLIYDEQRKLLFGTSSTHGGTSTTPLTDRDAVIFVYDVQKMELVATCNLRQELSGMNVNISFIAGIEKDPDYAANGMFWGVVSETLFAFTYDENEKSFSVTEQLSFDKNTYWYGGSRQWFPRSFVFVDDSLYVAFDKTGGLCRVNREDPSQFQQLITDSTGTNVPNSYVLGEDGALYYIANGALYVLNLNPTQEQQENAGAVNALIGALPETVSAQDVQQIYQAKNAYDALPVLEKALITDAVALDDAWIDLLVARIALLEQTLTAENMDLIESLKADYDKVPMQRRSEITNYAVLAQLNDIVLQSNYSVPGVGFFSNLADAQEAAPAEGQITLMRDSTETEVILQKGITLELNGHTLTAESVACDFAPDARGYIVDSSDGNNGLLKTENSAIFSADNADLPLYDEENSGYRFFDWDLYLHSATDAAGTGRQKFWFKFQLRTNDTDGVLDQDAYRLIAAGGTGLEINAKLRWNGNALQTVVFGKNGSPDAFSQSWATGATESRWLYLVVSGMTDPVLRGTLEVEPQITVNGVTACAGTIRYEKNDVDFGFVDRK